MATSTINRALKVVRYVWEDAGFLVYRGAGKGNPDATSFFIRFNTQVIRIVARYATHNLVRIIMPRSIFPGLVAAPC
ncbi:MAG: hypothetical protein K8S97_15450 [Anaerolineae bacterium]|nr:hypothetical protein [Anaerolineae bacterium]